MWRYNEGLRLIMRFFEVVEEGLKKIIIIINVVSIDSKANNDNMKKANWHNSICVRKGMWGF